MAERQMNASEIKAEIRKQLDIASEAQHKIAELYHKTADSGEVDFGALTVYQQDLNSQIKAQDAVLWPAMTKLHELATLQGVATDGWQNSPSPLPVEDAEPEPSGDTPAEGPNAGPVVEVPGQLPHEIEKPPVNAWLEQMPAMWLGSWYSDVWSVVREKVIIANGRESVFIPYNVVNRDNGNYSAGGVRTKEEYWGWSGQIADAIGQSPAWVLIEPDALGLLNDLSEEQRQVRYDCIQGAIDAYNTKPNIRIYVDASVWVEPAEMARRLLRLHGFDGFSLNVSGYEKLEECLLWAEEVSRQSGGLHYVVDTSRNGRGNPRPGKWCNVTDTLVGLPASRVTASKNCDAYLHAKVVGESDGKGINDDGSHPRNDVPSAGELFPEYKAGITSGEWNEFNKKFGI